jgi:UDP-N-acetylglucosamine acyltransferase
MSIHPTSIVQSPFEASVRIGPFSIIDEDVTIGPESEVDSHVHVYTHTRIGRACRIFHGASVGNIPQDMKFQNEYSELVIGDRTVIREYATINRGTAAAGQTRIGSDCLLMAYVHIGHDSTVGDHVILANNVTLGGHVVIDDYAGVGGLVPIHQFCRVGKYAFIGGGYRAVQDVPPFILAAGEPLRYEGLNYVGLRRHGFTPERLHALEQIYHVIYREGLNRKSALQKIADTCPPSDDREDVIRFFESSERGVIR